jgi:hypothetical protein
MPPLICGAEMVLPSRDFAADLALFTGTLGFRLDTIFPADDPAVATLSGYGLRVRLDRHATHAPGVLRLLSDRPDAVAGGARTLTTPGGTTVQVVDVEAPLVRPATDHAFMVRRLVDGAPWVIGRAGMRYRDLIPGRLGGSIIASHIRIPDAGPVPDMVHYHTVGFQLIYCYTGWVRLVYEDQGPPFILAADDCVIQPPQIRHRVLESSDNLQVIEIGVPAEHVTTVDHDLTLPTAVVEPGRDFGAGGVEAVAYPRLRGTRDGHQRRHARRRLRAGGSSGWCGRWPDHQPRLRYPLRVRAVRIGAAAGRGSWHPRPQRGRCVRYSATPADSVLGRLRRPATARGRVARRVRDHDTPRPGAGVGAPSRSNRRPLCRRRCG